MRSVTAAAELSGSCSQNQSSSVAPQVSAVLGLGAAACCGELAFMESYKEVLVELGRVEQKMESQSMSSSSSSSEGLGSAAGTGGGRSRLGSSGRSTLQAIGSAAAAGATPRHRVLLSRRDVKIADF